jgi:hypothetical protein
MAIMVIEDEVSIILHDESVRMVSLLIGVTYTMKQKIQLDQVATLPLS